MSVETSALILYTVLFCVSGFLERPLQLDAAERSSVADVKRLNAFRPPEEWREQKENSVDDDDDDGDNDKDATSINNVKRRKEQQKK